MRKLLLFVLLLLVFGACGEILTPDSDHDLFEAFFRYKFDNNFSGSQENAESYFLEIEGQDPSPELLARFKGHSPRVKKGSEFILTREIEVDGEAIIVGNGVLFRIDGYKRFGLFRKYVKISGGYAEGDLSASWATYIFVKKGGKWELLHVFFGAIA